MPAIASTGQVSLSDLATEFNDTQPNSMSEFYRNGDRVPGNNSNVPTAGLVRISNFRGAINQIAQTATNGSNVDLATLFGSDWTSTVPKVYTVPSGVTVGGTGGTAAITASSTMQGTLTIEVTGSVIGTGGAVGGNGGDAISNAASGVTLTVNNGGLVAGGGGGGGTGGVGGNGSYSSTSYGTEYYQVGGDHAYYVRCSSQYGYALSWNNQYSTRSSCPTTVYIFGQNLARRSFVTTSLYNYYKISTYSTSNVTTSGGSGGSGGVGQGYNQTNASGSAGASGGTNAGAGGTGGSGGTYGNAGGTGGTGANGNSTNGNAGLSGGSAGAAVSGTALSAYTNNGTVNGTVST